MNRILLIALLAASSNASAGVTTSTDRFTGLKTTEAVEPINARDNFIAFYKFEQNSFKTIYMIIGTTANDWKYLGCESQSWLIDGIPANIPDGKYMRKVGRGYVTENLNVKFDAQTIKLFQNATKVEYKLCNNEFEIAPETITDIKAILSAP